MTEEADWGEARELDRRELVVSALDHYFNAALDKARVLRLAYGSRELASFVGDYLRAAISAEDIFSR